MTTQQTDALRLANVCSNLTRYSMDAHLIAAELLTQHARINELESQLAQQRFDAADMATAAAQGFRDGVASVNAGSEPVPNNRRSLEAVFRGLSDRAYCNYIEQMHRDACLGWEYKAAHGKFGEAELEGHTLAGEMLGRHKAFDEAANALRGSDAPLTYPAPQGQVPEALRLADMIERYNAGVMSQKIAEDYIEAAAELRRLHTYCRELESQVIRDCMSHVQNPTESAQEDAALPARIY